MLGSVMHHPQGGRNQNPTPVRDGTGIKNRTRVPQPASAPHFGGLRSPLSAGGYLPPPENRALSVADLQMTEGHLADEEVRAKLVALPSR